MPNLFLYCPNQIKSHSQFLKNGEIQVEEIFCEIIHAIMQMKWRYQINAQDSRKYICKEIIQLSILNWIYARKKTDEIILNLVQ